jgi:hypothetical protein
MPRRKLETFDDFNRALKNKYGIGENASYKPWLRVQDVKSSGVRSQINGVKSGRTHHLLSAIETEFFYLAEFSESVVDIREQFPLLPINLSIKIAKTLDIKHPTHPTSQIPIVITTDFLITRNVNGKKVYEAYSVKPEKDSNKLRVLEKIEIERVWWDLFGIKFNYFTGNQTTQIQSKNVNWATHIIRSNKNRFSEDQLLAALQYINVGLVLIKEVCDSFALYLNVKQEHVLELLRCLIGYKYIEVDLSIALERSDFITVYSISDFNQDLALGNS